MFLFGWLVIIIGGVCLAPVFLSDLVLCWIKACAIVSELRRLLAVEPVSCFEGA